MKYQILGREDAAETILLSSGLGGTGAYWRPQYEALGEHFRVIVYDQRGTGVNAEVLPEDYSIGHMADDVLSILQNAEQTRCHFVGHALGGLVGLEIARRSPESLSSLVLVNAWAKLDPHTRRCFAARTALLDRVGPEAYVHAQPIFLYPAAWQSTHQQLVEAEVTHAIEHFQGSDNLKKRIKALLKFDVSADLQAILKPTLVVATRDDILVPFTSSETLANNISNAELWLTSEGGHANTVTNPEVFNRTVLEFLGSTHV